MVSSVRVPGGHCVATAIRGTAPKCIAWRDSAVFLLEDGWRLEPEGEKEKLDTKVVSNGVEGVSEYPDDEGRHEETDEAVTLVTRERVRQLTAEQIGDALQFWEERNFGSHVNESNRVLPSRLGMCLVMIESTVPPPPVQQSQSLLGMVKLGVPSLRRTVQRQNPMSQCSLVELGRHGPEPRALASWNRKVERHDRIRYRRVF